MSHSEHRNRFNRIMMAIAEAVGSEIAPTTVEIYWRVLEGYPIEIIAAAAKQVLRSWRFSRMPPPAEFVRAIEGAPGEQEARVELEAREQAKDLVRQVKTVGVYGAPNFADPRTSDFVLSRYGSWVALCQNLQEADIHWITKDMIEFFSTCETVRQCDKKLLGWHEQNRRAIRSGEGPAAIGEIMKQIDNNKQGGGSDE